MKVNSLCLGLDHFQVLRSNYLLTNRIEAPLLISPTYNHWRRRVKNIGWANQNIGNRADERGGQGVRCPGAWCCGRGPGEARNCVKETRNVLKHTRHW